MNVEPQRSYQSSPALCPRCARRQVRETAPDRVECSACGMEADGSLLLALLDIRIRQRRVELGIRPSGEGIA